MANVTEAYLYRDGDDPRALIQRAMDRVAAKAQEFNYIVDWTSMTVFQDTATTSNSLIPTVQLMGINVSGSPA